jgi:hypothetical protein
VAFIFVAVIVDATMLPPTESPAVLMVPVVVILPDIFRLLVVADKTAVFTNAVVASWVLLVPVVAVGAVGFPVKAGELSEAFVLSMEAVSEYLTDCPDFA